MKFKGFAYIYTIGCQMNAYDSEKLFSILRQSGYERTDSFDKADIIVCNTCSVREKAQEKAFSFLGRITEKKKKQPHLISIMAGCVAQQEGDAVFKRIPSLNIVIGTQAFERLQQHITSVQNGKNHITDIETSDTIYESMPDFKCIDKNKVSRFVTIMQGCDNFCTYCIVPYVRGRERSRSPESIIKEISILAESGVKEVTLLGQNVNSYGKKEGICSFAELLSKVALIDGIKRIRFATSHPKDLSDELISAMGELDKVCKHLHLPVQSGSNRILKKMNRGYTRENYLERITKLRKTCPDIALSSDMIVGFPGETEDDFNATLSIVKQVEFDGLFAFAYSDRPNAPAAKFSEKIGEKEKISRLNELLQLQEYYTEKKNMAIVGKIEPVMVEGKSMKRRHSQEDRNNAIPQMTGRTDSGKIVHFHGENINPGDIVNIEIKEAYPHSLWGRLSSVK